MKIFASSLLVIFVRSLSLCVAFPCPTKKHWPRRDLVRPDSSSWGRIPPEGALTPRPKRPSPPNPHVARRWLVLDVESLSLGPFCSFLFSLFLAQQSSDGWCWCGMAVSTIFSLSRETCQKSSSRLCTLMRTSPGRFTAPDYSRRLTVRAVSLLPSPSALVAGLGLSMRPPTRSSTSALRYVPRASNSAVCQLQSLREVHATYRPL